MLAKLRREMKVVRYIPGINFALCDLEEEKETEFWYHSEKLTLAFGLICIPLGVPIRITPQESSYSDLAFRAEGFEDRRAYNCKVR
ncbi:hypothetical protein HHK36_006443 [Tetracentron sinense]|uniref:DYW domain-containing protein n=1 Tax=Tetracentron sinense TaxID=13715 RepID=A0A834ZPN9_TETSI|nr:hypothetical protein HHK36_006443 [Tetracentron sinense]